MKKVHYLFIAFISVFFIISSCDDEPLEGVFSETGDGSPIGTPDSDSELCLEAFETLQSLQVAFANANEDTFSNACTTYQMALEATIELCGDSGNLQSILSGLGDCTEADPCFQAEVNSDAALNALNNATSDNEEELCINYSIALENQIMVCGDDDGSIQLLIDNLNCGGDCALAREESSIALAIFNEVDILNEMAYREACAAYSMALQNEIGVCGDADGSLQIIVQELGGCDPSAQEGPVRFNVNDVLENFIVANVTIEGSLLTVVAERIDNDDTFTFDIVLAQTGENVMQNVVFTSNGVMYASMSSGSQPFVNVITVNDGGEIIGTFNGSFIDSDGSTIITTDGMLEIEY